MEGIIASIRPFSDGSRVVHVGPPKTATSSLQGALHLSREQLAEHGVRYAGKTRHPRGAATYAALGRVAEGNPERNRRTWKRLATQMRESTDRVIMTSSESFSLADDDAVASIVGELGEGVEVVITIRPLGGMLSSAWQQRVRNEETRDYDTWLRSIFQRDADGTFTAGYWKRFGIDRLARRWGAAVGLENVTVVVLDPTDRDMLLRSFDALLGLPEGTLRPDARNRNESLSYPEVETLRHFNRAFIESGRSRGEWVNAVRRKALTRIRLSEDPMFEPFPIETPRWAVEAANDRVAAWVDFLGSSPVNVVGDPAQLVVDPAGFPAEVSQPQTVSTRSAAAIALLMYESAQEHFVPRVSEAG